MVVVTNAEPSKKKNSFLGLRASKKYDTTFSRAIQVIQETQQEVGGECFA